MKIVLLGAAGATGLHVIPEALKRGHEVVAYVRNAEKLPKDRPGLTFYEGSLEDERMLALAFEGAKGVVSTLGVARGTPRSSPARSLPRVIDAMRKHGLRRYVGLSGAALTLPGERKDLAGKVVSSLVKLFSPAVFEDKWVEYQTLARSELEWVLIRAPLLVEGPSTGTYRLDLDRPHGRRVNRGDVADALLRQLESTEYLGRAPYIAGR